LCVHDRRSHAGRYRFAADELRTVQLVTGIDDALLNRRRELMRAQGRRRLMVLLAVVGTLAALGGYKLLEMSSAFSVDSVTVSGAPPLLQRQIQSAVQAAAGGHSLLTLNRGAIEAQVEQYPYVRSVIVDRAFPHTLALTVQVEQPVVAATVGKTAYLVSTDGRVLEQRKTVPARLPTLPLPNGTTLIVGRQSGDANLRAALAVLAQMPAGFRGAVGKVTALTAHSGVIAAMVGRHIQLRLGTPTNLGLKLQVVQRVMHHITRAQRSELAFVDVSAPSRPAYGLRSTLPSTGG
jgi:cell division septal protein FtsQ